MFYTPEQMGITQTQVNEICETLWKKELETSNNTCHDCGVKPNEQHKEGCDAARCTSCGGQRLSCDCEDGEPDIWTGLWAGIKECYENKMICYDTAMGYNRWCFDLNRWSYEKMSNKK